MCSSEHPPHSLVVMWPLEMPWRTKTGLPRGVSQLLSFGNLRSPGFLFPLIYFFKTVKYKLYPCVCIFFSSLQIMSGPLLAQHSVYPWSSCPHLLAGQFASIFFASGHLSCLWNQVPGIREPLLLLPLFASLCMSYFLLSAWPHSSKLEVSLGS